MTSEIRLYLVTWNVGESNPPDDLGPLLGLDEKELPDLYAIGLQELKSDTTTLISDSLFDDPWTNAISSTLCQRGYVRVKSLRLVGIHLSVYIKRSQLLDISTIESEFTRTGYAGLWGSKGGVSIRLDVHGVNLCFINSHFSAHQENFALRIEDYNQVLMSQKFRDPDCPRILDNDYVFWLGDLNFRLNDLSNEVVRQKVGSEEYEELLKHDQLNDARSKNMIFLNFEEGGISFPPTFKFDVGTDTYDTSSKCRIPAWCDRILWRVHEDAFAGTTLSVTQHKYTSLPEYKNSDHKPVVSSFTIKVLQDSPSQPVMFEPLSCWSRGKDQKVTYSISKVFPTCGRDWIGLYPVNFKNFEEYSTYNWVPQRGEDNQDGTFLCSIVFEERDLRSLPSGRYKLLYFSAVHNHAVGYSDELELLELDHATSSEDELVRPGEADVDHPLRVTPDAQPSGLRATKHPLDPASSEVDSEEKSMKKVEEIIEKEQVEPVKVEKLETPETEKVMTEEGKVVCEVEKPTTDEKVVCEVEKPNAVEKVLCEVEKPTTDEKVVCEVEKPTAVEKVVCEVEKPTAVEKVVCEVEKPTAVEKVVCEVEKPTTVEKVVCEVEKPTTDEKVVCEVEKPTTVEKVVCEVEKPTAVEKVVCEVEKPTAFEKVVCEVEKPTTDEKVVCEVEKPTAVEKVVCEVEKPTTDEETLPKGEDFVPAIENLNVEVVRLPREIEEPLEEIDKLTTEIKQLSSVIAKLDAEVENSLMESEKLPLEINKLSSERNSTDKLIVEVGKLPEEVEKEDHQLPLSTGPEFALATPAIEMPPAEVTEAEKSAVDSAPVKIVFHHDGKAAAVGEDHHQHGEQKEDQVVSESPKHPQGVEEVVGEVSGTPSAVGEESYEDIDIISSPTPEAIRRLTEELSDPKTKLLSYEEFHKEIEAAFSSRDVDGADALICDFDVPKLLDPPPPTRTEVPGAAQGEEVPLRSGSEFSDGKVPPSVEDDSKVVGSQATKTEFEPMIRLEDIQKEHDYSKRIEPSSELESQHQVEEVAARTADALNDVSEAEQLQMVVDTQEKKALDGLNASVVQETSVDRRNIIIIQQEQQKQITPSDPEALGSPKQESSQDVGKMSKDIQASDHVPFEIVEEVVLAKNTSVQAAFKPEEDISSLTDSKKESLKELEIEKDEESESQTQSSSSDFEVIQLPSKHSTLESFEDAYLSMRGEALADKEDVEDARKETMEKVAVQSALRSTESEPKDPELIESINAQLLEQNMSGFVESLGDFGADDLPSIEDSANVKLEQATKSSVDGKMEEESKQEEECIVVKEGVVYEGDETSIKNESDLLAADVKVAKESQPQVEHASEKKVVEFVDNVVATAVQEAVTSCLSLEDDRPKHEPQETFVLQNDEKVKTKVSDETAPSSILGSIEQVKVVQCLDVASHPHVKEDKVEVTEQQQHHHQEKPQQIQQQELLHESDLADLAQQSQQALPHSDIEVKKESLTASSAAPPSTSDLETEEKHLEVQPPQSPEKEKDAPPELSTDDLGKSTPDRLQPSEGQKGAPNFFDAYMDLREKSLADKEQEDKNEKRKEDPIPSTIITQGALKDVDSDLIGKNLSDLSEDMGLEKEKPKDEPKQEEQDGKYEARKEAELLIGDELKTKSHTVGDSQHHDVTSEQPELVKENEGTAALSQESLVVDPKQVLQTSEMPFEGDCSTRKEVQSTRTTVFQAPTQDPSLEKTELYQTKPSEVREEIHEPTNQIARVSLLLDDDVNLV